MRMFFPLFLLPSFPAPRHTGKKESGRARTPRKKYLRKFRGLPLTPTCPWQGFDECISDRNVQNRKTASKTGTDATRSCNNPLHLEGMERASMTTINAEITQSTDVTIPAKK